MVESSCQREPLERSLQVVRHPPALGMMAADIVHRLRLAREGFVKE